MNHLKEAAIQEIDKLTIPDKSGAIIEIEQQRAIAETQAAMIIAKRFPRDQIAATDKIQNACTRIGLAEAALYQYARGGNDITGPSIRLAEAIAQNWGNIQFGIREVDQRKGISTIEAFAWDVETNVRQVKIFQVPHKRYTRKGTYDLEDPRDIYEAVANQGARRLRSCILGVIPGDVIESAVKQCEKTLTTKAEVTPERIESLIEMFSKYGVTVAQIEKRIQRRIDSITPALMVNLGKIYNSLKDGMSSAVDWFEPDNKVHKAAETALAESVSQPEAPETGSGKQNPESESIGPPADAAIQELIAAAREVWKVNVDTARAVLNSRVTGEYEDVTDIYQLSYVDAKTMTKKILDGIITLTE